MKIIGNIAFICITVCCSACVFADDLIGHVNIVWDKPQQVQFTPDVKVFPGEKLTIISSGQVDIDHHYWESRECNWFGLHCWYEQHDQANPVGAASLEVEIKVEGGNSTAGASPYLVTYPLTADSANFTDGVRIAAMIWTSGKGQPSNRGPCIGRPDRCSVGELTLTLTANVDDRLIALKDILGKQTIKNIDPSAIRSREFIDPLLSDPGIANPVDIGKLSEILTEAIWRFRQSIAEKTDATFASQHMKIIDLAGYTLNLSNISLPNAAKLRIAIMESYLDRGEYAQATTVAPQTMDAAKKAFTNAATSDTALLYAMSLRDNAIAWRERQTRNSSSDIRVAIALLDQAVEILWDFSATKEISEQISQISVDAARMLNLLRTSAELQAGEQRLAQAICFQMHAEKSAGKTFVDWQKTATDASVGDCKLVQRPPK